MLPAAAVAVPARADFKVEGAVDAVLLGAVDACQVGRPPGGPAELPLAPVAPAITTAAAAAAAAAVAIGRWATPVVPAAAKAIRRWAAAVPATVATTVLTTTAAAAVTSAVAAAVMAAATCQCRAKHFDKRRRARCDTRYKKTFSHDLERAAAARHAAPFRHAQRIFASAMVTSVAPAPSAWSVMRHWQINLWRFSRKSES